LREIYLNISPLKKELLKDFYREIEKLEKGEIVSIKIVSESKYLDATGKKITEQTISYLTRI